MDVPIRSAVDVLLKWYRSSLLTGTTAAASPEPHQPPGPLPTAQYLTHTKTRTQHHQHNHDPLSGNKIVDVGGAGGGSPALAAGPLAEGDAILWRHDSEGEILKGIKGVGQGKAPFPQHRAGVSNPQRESLPPTATATVLQPQGGART